MSLISLLALLIIVCLVFWCVHTLGGSFGVPAPIITVIDVILVVIIVLYLLQFLGGAPALRLR
jgi:hypothetical protein